LLREEQMLGRIARQFRLPEEQLRNRMTALRRARQSRPAPQRRDLPQTPAPMQSATKLTAWDRDLLSLVLLDPSYLARIEGAENRPSFTSPVAGQIYRKCLELADESQPVAFDRLLLEFDDAATKNVLVSLDEFCQDEELHQGDREQWLQDLLSVGDRRQGEEQRRQALAAAKTNQVDAESLLARFCEESRSKQLSHFERRKK
jgi:hypothetical protein